MCGNRTMVDTDVLLCCCVVVGQDFNYREAKLVFIWSRMVVIDDLLDREKYTTLSYIDFLEALVRVGVMSSMPDEEELRRLRVRDAYNFFERLAREGGNSSTCGAWVCMLREHVAECCVAHHRSATTSVV